MAISEKPWDGSASNYPDAASFCRASLVNENTGDSKDWTKDKCHLPVRTPDGALSRAGVHAAAARIGQTQISPADKKSAAKKLISAYHELDETPPDSLKRLAQ